MPVLVDLLSDTVTRPTPAMRQAMAEALVGDDVFDADPTVNRLQEVAAERMGKEAALFVPTGTMGNSIAMKTHTQPGDEILLDGEAHSMVYEVGLPAVIAGVLTRQFRGVSGVPNVEEIASLIHEESLHTPRTSLIVLENTHNRAGGAIIPLEVHRQVWELAQTRNIRVHIDGARLFNAVVATGVPAKEFAQYTDSVTFCLSKGLGCPVGSLLCGTREFIGRAKRVRKMLGGGMRQVGILAAAGLYALEHHIDRLAQDHQNAQVLAQGIAGAEGITVEPVATNMVYFKTATSAPRFVEEMERRGVIAYAVAAHRIRMVTHLDISTSDIQHAITTIRETAERGYTNSV
jgi:threonine aldolase